MELAHRTRVVVFDKTGTLTEGKCRVTDLLLLAPGGSTGAAGTGMPGASSSWDMPHVLRLLLAVESGSEHPLGRAMVEYARAQLGLEAGAMAEGQVEDFESVPGRGIKCRWVVFWHG